VESPPLAARQRRLILDTLLLGVVGALAAQVFTVLLRFTNGLFLSVRATTHRDWRTKAALRPRSSGRTACG